VRIFYFEDSAFTSTGAGLLKALKGQPLKAHEGQPLKALESWRLKSFEGNMLGYLLPVLGDGEGICFACHVGSLPPSG